MRRINITDCNWGDCVTTTKVCQIDAQGIELRNIRVLSKTGTEHAHNLSGLCDDSLAARRVGGLGGPPIGNFSLQRRIILEGQIGDP